MFTGIVEEIGAVRELRRADGGVSLSVRAAAVLEGLGLGDSMSVDGACLTITDLDHDGFTVGLSPETLRRTTLGRVTAGTRLNLERAVRAGDRLGGHFVQGHVDCVATIVGTRQEGDSFIVSFEVPPEAGRYIVEKGFVAVDGISLTVTERKGDCFSVALVAYTQTHVALLDKHESDGVNIEVDILAKYVESILGDRLQATGYR